MDAAGAARPRSAPAGVVRLGKYELLSRLAVGGMAELFVARTTAQHGFEKVVALKRILASHADDDQFVEMLLQEARLAATLHHPNIAQVYDVGECDGTYFFTMEYVFGQDLRKIVRAIQKQGRWLAPEHVLQIVIGTAAGLHYAHEMEGSDGKPLGIVHRDVSPSNVLVSYDGAVKLVDFGIARVSSMSTQSGEALKGKIPYMSPEQCRGERLDRRSDVFSLGIMLWELTVRRRLFAGDNDIALAAKICTEDAPRPSEFVPDYPADLEAIVVKALARDRDRRYPTAQALQVDLEEYAREHKLLLSSAKLGTFMSELFADVIKTSKIDLRDRIAASTGMFQLPVLDESGGGSLSAPSIAGSGAATIGDDDATAIHTGGSGLSRRGDAVGMTPRQRKLAAAAGGGVAALVLGLALFAGGDDEPTPTPAPAPDPVQAPAVVAPPVAPADDDEIVELVDDPPADPPTAVDPTPTKPTAKKPAGKTVAKKRGGKPTTKKPTNWDPDSPLPPP
jgi:serine/threonine protein kinase